MDFLQRQYEKKREQDPDLPKPTAEAPEPFALEAKQFTEALLLNRDVQVCDCCESLPDLAAFACCWQVVLQGVDAFGNFFGSILYPKGNISVKLLEKGFGKLVSWSAAITPDAAKLAEAEA